MDVERIDSLSNNSKEFTDLLSQSFSTSDLWPLLSSLYKSSVPSTSRDIQTWIKSYISHSRQHFFKEGSSLDIDLNENDIFINSAIHQQFKYPQQLTLDNLRSLKSTDLSSKLRIIQIKKSKSYFDNPIPDQYSSASQSVEAKVFKDPAINTTKDEITKDKNHENTFKFFDAPPGVVSEALACFKSISHELNLPKFDVINSLLEEQSSKEMEKSLSTFVLLSLNH